MAALSACMDKHTPKAVGENGNVEYTWSHDIKERIMQLHFQLVRCTPERGEELRNTYLEILNEILQHKKMMNCSVSRLSCLQLLVILLQRPVERENGILLTFLQSV